MTVIDDTPTVPDAPVTPGQAVSAQPAAKPKKAKAAKPAQKAAGAPAKAKAPKAAAPKKRASKAAKANGKAPKKAAKAKRQRDPGKLDPFGYRIGSIRSTAAGMYASKKGATLGEVKAKVGSIQFNVLTELKERGFKRKEVREPSKSGREVTRYFVHAR